MKSGLFILLALSLCGCLKFQQGPLTEVPSSATFLEMDGHRIRYVDEGKGPVVLLIHGFGSNLGVWDHVRKRLKKEHRVIAIDLLGFGYSDRPKADYSHGAQARRVVAIMDRLGVKKAALVGHSWGAAVALELARAQPKRITRLALYNAWVYANQQPTLFYWSRASGVGEALIWLFYSEQAEKRLEQSFYNPERLSHQMVVETEAAMARDGAGAVALAVVRGQRFEESEKHYHEVKQPTLILWGRQDHIALLSVGVRLSNQLPKARLKVFEQCGHFTMLEAPNSTLVLADFLAQGNGS